MPLPGPLGTRSSPPTAATDRFISPANLHRRHRSGCRPRSSAEKTNGPTRFSGLKCIMIPLAMTETPSCLVGEGELRETSVGNLLLLFTACLYHHLQLSHRAPQSGETPMSRVQKALESIPPSSNVPVKLIEQYILTGDRNVARPDPLGQVGHLVMGRTICWRERLPIIGLDR